jgi:hypothetical protein
VKVLAAPAVHPDLAATAALPAAHKNGAATWIQIGLGESAVDNHHELHRAQQRQRDPSIHYYPFG